VPIPWEAEGPSFGFGPGPAWLPQPAAWAALARAAQRDDPHSTLALYQAALRVRAELGGDGTLEWLERGPQRLVFRRQSGLICAVNFGPIPAGLPAGDVLITSGPIDDGRLPTDTAAWIRG
jgi:alpha-glucosidase